MKPQGIGSNLTDAQFSREGYKRHKKEGTAL